MSLENSTSSSSFYNIVYKSRINVLELLAKQGYNVEDYHGFSTGELHSMINNKQLDMLLENKDNTKPRIYVKYFAVQYKTIKINHISTIIDDLVHTEQLLNSNDIIFVVTHDNPNDTIVNELKKIWEQEGIHIIVYSLKRLQFNILNHDLVPPHIVLTDEEKNDFLKKYNIDTPKTQVPQISRFDPVAGAIFLKPGQMCKIIRPSKTAIKGLYYRYCINN
jgi:DNA-directed RNA polymerase subunit H (RpoH/RPB5)